MEERSSEVSRGRRLAILVVVLGAQFMVIIDETVVNVALPSMGRDLHMSQADLSWVMNAYMLLFGGFLLLSGRMADLFGRRRVFLVGLVVFTAASLAAGFADDRMLLIGMRGAQGLGGALLSPAALSILTTTFRDPAGRRMALAAWAALLGLGATVGVLLGGVIVEFWSWHWIFWVNGPVGVVVLIGCLVLVPATLPGVRRQLDVPGAVLVTGAGLLLVYTVVRTDEVGWRSTSTLAGLALVGLLLLGFLLVQRATAEPLVPRPAIARRGAVAYLVTVLVASGLFGMFFFVTLYMQVLQGWSALQAGLAWAPQGATVAVVSGVGMRLVPVLGVRVLSTSGLVIAAVAQLLLLRTDLTGSYVSQLLPALLVNAVGLGLALVPLGVVVVHGLADEHHGIASGLMSAAQQLGGAVGLAVLVSVALGSFRHQARSGTAPMEATLSAFHTGYATAAGFMLVGAALALFLPPVHEKVDVSTLAG